MRILAARGMRELLANRNASGNTSRSASLVLWLTNLRNARCRTIEQMRLANALCRLVELTND
jgi:hypothetical protein